MLTIIVLVAAAVAGGASVPEIRRRRAAVRAREAEAAAEARRQAEGRDAENRAAAQARSDADLAERRAATDEEHRLVRTDPVRYVSRLWRRYCDQRRDALEAGLAVAETDARAALDHEQTRLDQVKELERTVPRIIQQPGAARTAVVVGAFALPVVLLASVPLDYAMFRAFLPVYAAALVTPTVILGVAAMSFLFGAGVGWHGVFAERSKWFRELVAWTCGAATVAMIALLGYMAPARDAARTDANVRAAQVNLAAAQEAGAGPQVVDDLVKELDHARGERTRTARIDTCFTVGLALLEVVLVEAALVASQIRPLKRGRGEHEAAQVSRQDSEAVVTDLRRGLAGADNAFAGLTLEQLQAAGVTDPIPPIIAEGVALGIGTATVVRQVVQHTSAQELHADRPAADQQHAPPTQDGAAAPPVDGGGPSGAAAAPAQTPHEAFGRRPARPDPQPDDPQPDDPQPDDPQTDAPVPPHRPGDFPSLDDLDVAG